MLEARTCSHCEAPLAGDEPDGFCPACALQGALNLGLLPALAPPVPAQPACAAEAASARRRPDTRHPTPGTQQFGNYELLDEIARGGMGIVYRARQVGLDRVVALKLILFGQFADEAAVKRFRAESTAAARLQHPNIVAIHEVGEQGGQHFFSMDYVAGRNLADLMREGPIPAKRAAELLKTIAEAIHYAHGQGIVHRDLKPSNILLDEAGEPRVTDFGLAKNLKIESDLTLTGQVLGSPNFIAPEQVAGKTDAVGPCSDIFSLGAVLYQLLTGRPPFAAETLSETLHQVLTCEPPAPRLLSPATPRDLETICLKCLQKAPRQRYDTAQDLANELGRFLRNEPIHSRPVSRLEKVWRWSLRKPQVAGLIVSLVLVFLVGFAAVLWQLRRAEAGELNARRNAYASDMNVAQQALAANNMGRVWDLLNRNRPRPGQLDLRQWEWRYLWSRCQGDWLFNLGPHSNAVRGIAFSPDGKVLGTSDWDGTITLWDVANRRALATRQQGGLVVALAFSEDGKWLASGGAGLRVWRTGSWKEEFSLPETNTSRAIALSPDGRLLAASSMTVVRIWNLATRQVVTNLPGAMITSFHHGPVCFSPDGRFFAIGDMDGHVRVFALPSWEQKLSVAAASDGISTLAFSPDGQLLASGAGYTDSTIRLWETETGRPVRQLVGHEAWVTTVRFSEDGKSLATGSADRTIRLWRVADGALLQTLRGHLHEIWALAHEPKGSRLVSGSKNGDVFFWDTKPKPGKEPLRLLPGIAVLRFSPDGKTLATANRDGSVSLRDSAGLQELKTLAALGTNNVSVLFSPEGKELVVGDHRGRIKVWTVGTDRQRTGFVAHARASVVLGFINQGKALVTTDTKQHVKIWSTATWGELQSLPIQTERVHVSDLELQWWQNSLASVTPEDSTLLVPGSPSASSSSISLLPLDGSQSVITFKAHQQMIFSMRFSPDGTTLASAASDGLVKLWDWPSRCHRATLSGHLLAVYAVCFSPDGGRLASASAGKEAVKLWDMATRQEVATLPGQGAQFLYVTFSPDGDTLVALNQEGVAYFWRAPSWAEIDSKERSRSSFTN